MWVRAFASSTSSWAIDLSIQLMKPDFWFFPWVSVAKSFFFFSFYNSHWVLYLSPIVRWKLLNRSLFYVAGDHKSYFIPGLVGPFLEMTLIPHSGKPNCWCKTHSFVSLLIKPLIIIIWLNPRAGKVKRILRSEWLPERRRWARPVFLAWNFSR